MRNIFWEFWHKLPRLLSLPRGVFWLLHWGQPSGPLLSSIFYLLSSGATRPELLRPVECKAYSTGVSYLALWSLLSTPPGSAFHFPLFRISAFQLFLQMIPPHAQLALQVVSPLTGKTKPVNYLSALQSSWRIKLVLSTHIRLGENICSIRLRFLLPHSRLRSGDLTKWITSLANPW